MAFGNGLTGVIVASIVTLSSGAAFIICFREFFREVLEIGSGEDSTARSTELATAIAPDDVPRAWESRQSYLAMVGLLGFVAIAGFIAGLTHFASSKLS